MNLLLRLTFGIAVGVGVLTLYSQVSHRLPVERTVCLDGERFTMHRAWQGIGRMEDGRIRMEWESWMTPDGRSCGGSGSGAVATNPDQTG